MQLLSKHSKFLPRNSWETITWSYLSEVIFISISSRYPYQNCQFVWFFSPESDYC